MRASPGRARGYLVVVLVVVGLAAMTTWVFGRSYSVLSLQKEPFHRVSYVPSFDPVEDVTLGLPPNSGNALAPTRSAAIRAIMVYPTQTILLVAGHAVKIIDVVAPTSLHALVRVVANPDWLAESGRVITMKAAVVAEQGSSLTVGAPYTSEVVMQVRAGVLLAAEKATLNLTQVYVHASDAGVPTGFVPPDQVADRPFILAITSTMTVSRCTLRYLGRDWNSSYGVSWSKNSTGSATDSVFDHNFVGLYTNAATGLKVIGNQFSHNSLYGIDPHSASTNIDVENNTSDYNGRHGIIFSENVTASIVRNNTTRGNGLNGIMMDESSSGNTIDHNVVADNKSDGIVVSRSNGDFIVGNTISGNRVGISVREGSARTFVSQNVISKNTVGIQGAEPAGNTVSANGGDWNVPRIGMIWAAGAALLLILLAITWSSERGRRSRHVRGAPRAWAGGPA